MYTQLMLTVNRPLTEQSVLTGAKWELNQAIKFLQRDHAFAYTERLAQFTYQPGNLFYDVGKICDGTLRDLMSVQLLNTSGLPQGKPMKVMTYNQLQGERKHFDRTHPSVGDFTDDWLAASLTDDSPITIESAFCQDRVVFIAGGNIGVYPTPKTAMTLMFNLHVWLPKLKGDQDTNFFLTYASDVVMMLALRKMHLYMKTDGRYQMTDAEVEKCLATLNTWDAQVRETSNTTMSPRNS